MLEKRVLPEFQSEAEEAAWWFDHQDEILDDFMAADIAGRLGSSPTLVYNPPSSNVFYLPKADAELAHRQAEQSGVAYEEYVKDLIHQALIQRAS